MLPAERIGPVPGGSGEIILVVEDEVIIRLDVAEYLRSEGFTVIEAGTAEEAIKVLRSVPVAVVFTDIRMPGSMDGIDLARYVEAEHPGVIIMVTSGHVACDELPEGLGPLISKPYLSTDILKKIRERLERRERG